VGLSLAQMEVIDRWMSGFGGFGLLCLSDHWSTGFESRIWVCWF